MKIERKDMTLYAVTDRRWLKDKVTLADQVEQAVKGGATFIQLRDKADGLKRETLLKDAAEVKAVCDRYKVPFVIDDDIEAALQVGADGVHVGQGDTKVSEARKLLGPDKIIGVSAHNVEEAQKAETDGADYLGCGAVFPTTTHKTATRLELSTLKAITEAVSIPVVAIGGINKENAAQLGGTGIDGAAVVTAIFGMPDIEKAAAELKSIIIDKVTG